MRKTLMSDSFGTIMVLLIAATAAFAQVASTGGLRHGLQFQAS